MKTDSFNLFVRELYKSKDGYIPLHTPMFKGKEKEYLLATVDSTFVSSVGKYVDQVESFLAKYTQTLKGVAVVNGTAAIQIALRLVGVNPGDEVITQALTFVATANSIAYNGAEPIFVDVDKDTMGMSPKALKAFLNEYGERRDQGIYNKKTGKRISAVLPMHTFGFMCRISEIQTICKEWGISCVEDAAEALGSQSSGKSAGSFGSIGAFSFNGNKIITAGGGGVLVTNDMAYGLRAKYLTTTAKRAHAFEYYHDEIGYNFRMPNLNAALLLGQLEKLEDYRSSKSFVYGKYRKFFDTGFTGAELMPIPDTTSQWNYWLMSIKLENRKARDEFLQRTNNKGVMTRPIWHLMYKLPMYSHCQRDDQSNAEKLEDTIVNIPSSAL